MRPRDHALPISEYALIGNRHTCALVARDGSIDWCCLPHLDSSSVFAALLDLRRGGFWRIHPDGPAHCTRRYLGASSVLESVFQGAGGVLRVRDFLPIRHGRGEERSLSAHAIVRSVTCIEGEVPMVMEWAPRPNYALDDVLVTRQGPLATATANSGTFWLAGLPDTIHTTIDWAAVRARHHLRAGDELHLVSGCGPPPSGSIATLAERYLEETLEWWEAWSANCQIECGADPWREPILRSGMVLKLLTNERSGAMAAAPTTSLPEELGGVRNWDYRFCWVRDASMISRAFVTLGHQEDGIAFLRFLERAAHQHRDPARIQVLYGLGGERHLPERTLGHLDGYHNSRPVRIGNAAAVQRQLDVYGELLEAAYRLILGGARPNAEQWAWLRSIANYVCTIWRWRDRGIWEVRGPERHFTYSKVMCWVALDRALHIARLLGGAEEATHWRRERSAIRKAILRHGYDSTRNSFVQSFDDQALDASNLLIPLTGFLPAGDPRVQGTIDATLRELTENGLVFRYRPTQVADGVSGDEGAFGICTFWLSTALSLAGRSDEARDIFSGMLSRANDVGLYAEEFDPATGDFLGNFPQAFTHVGLINSAHFLGQALTGSPEPPVRPEPALAQGDKII